MQKIILNFNTGTFRMAYFTFHIVKFYYFHKLYSVKTLLKCMSV